MTDFIVQFFAAGLLFVAVWLIGDKKIAGPVIGAIAEVFTTIVGVTHHAWSIVLIGVVLTILDIRTVILWRKDLH